MAVAPTRRVRTAHARTVALRTVAGACAGAILVVIFLRLVNIRAVFGHLRHLSIGLALLCGAAFLGAYVVRALRWRCLLSPYQVSVRRVVAIYQVAIFVNWLLPVRGGELMKCLLLRRSDGVPVSRSLATVGMDKSMDLLPAVGLLALLPFVSLHLGRPLWLLLLSALAFVVFGAVALGIAAWRRERALAVLTRLCAKVSRRDVRARIEPFLVGFLDTLLALVRRPRVMVIAVAYTAVAVALDALFSILAFRAVGVVVSIPVVLYGYTFFNLAFILPTPPGQIGSNELIGLLIFSGVFGVGRSGVGAMFLFSHPWTAILMTTSGLLCLSLMGLTLRGTLRLARGAGGREPT